MRQETGEMGDAYEKETMITRRDHLSGEGGRQTEQSHEADGQNPHDDFCVTSGNWSIICEEKYKNT